MTRSRWIIFILICLGVLGLVIFLSKKDNSAAFNGDATKVITSGSIADRTYGNTSDKVVLIEYADFECPGCETLYPTLKDIAAQYKNQLTFVFRELPLTTIHPNALAAATAAEAAGQQGKFFEYHDLLYDNQSAWKDASVSDRTGIFEGYAKQLNLDLNKFRSDLTSSAVADKISRDRTTASSFGLTSTPSLILDGQQLDQNNVVFDKTKLIKAINDELTKKGVALPATSSTGQ